MFKLHRENLLIHLIILISLLEKYTDANLLKDPKMITSSFWDLCLICQNRGTISSSFFAEKDAKQAARIAFSTTVAETLFSDSNLVGQLIRIGNIPFKVRGILKPMGIDPHSLDKDYEIIAPISTVIRHLMSVDYIMSAKLLLSDADYGSYR